MAAPRPVEVPSLRAVAREAGVSPSAVYLHFDSREALALAVVADLFADLRRTIDAADRPADSPADRLRATAHAVAGWAARRPGAYQVLFETEDLVPAEQGPGLDLLDRVAGLIRLIRDLPEAEERRLALRVWAVLHGVVSLRMHKQHAPWVAGPGEDLDAVIDSVLAWSPPSP